MSKHPQNAYLFFSSDIRTSIFHGFRKRAYRSVLLATQKKGICRARAECPQTMCTCGEIKACCVGIALPKYNTWSSSHPIQTVTSHAMLYASTSCLLHHCKCKSGRSFGNKMCLQSLFLCKTIHAKVHIAHMLWTLHCTNHLFHFLL